VLRRVHADGAWSGPALDTALRRSGLEARDRAFAANLAYATLRWEGTLDWALRSVVDRPLEQVQPEVLDVLRLGAWQLLYGAVPDRAAVGTAVDVARAEIGVAVTGFVNGVLRNLSRRKDGLPWPPERDERGLALRTGYPPWVVAECRARFGADARAVLEAGNDPPGVTLRAVADRDALAAELRAGGLEPQPAALAPEALAVRGADPSTIPAVAQGRAVVQDEASMVVARALAAGQGARWRALDLCAAPGGKTTHLAQLGATVAAADLRLARARLVAQAADRTRAQVAEAGNRTAAQSPSGRVLGVVAADSARPPWKPGTFDGVLLDAPCTGLGVVRRRPELRWRREAGDVERLATLQLTLLEAAAELVRPGGVLVYSVCTWTVAETSGVVSLFAALHGDRFTAQDTAAAGGLDSGPGAGVQLDPFHHGTDGMYLCRLRRRS
jgi:16S rRNA (cytosine967-C5)-methyltransferase